MTNEELRQEIEKLKQEIIELRFNQLESKAKNKPYEVEVPDDIGNYYHVDETGEINQIGEVLNYYDFEQAYLRGLVFKTKEEAEQFDKERVLITKLKDWAKEHNGGWKPDWGDFSKYNHAVTYDYCEKFYVKSYSCVNLLSKLPYLKSEEIAEQFIEEFEKEIKEVLC